LNKEKFVWEYLDNFYFLLYCCVLSKCAHRGSRVDNFGVATSQESVSMDICVLSLAAFRSWDILWENVFLTPSPARLRHRAAAQPKIFPFALPAPNKSLL
jgi:hypothetical protein